MKSVYREKLEYTKAIFNTKHGIMIYLAESLIWGFIIINYSPMLYDYLRNLISISNEPLRNYLAYLAFGVVLTPIGLIITFTLNRLFGIFFKDGKIIK